MPAKTKKEAKEKKGPVALPSPKERAFGTTVYTCRCSREQAVKLISDHGFRVDKDMGKEVALHADRKAYTSMRGEDK